MNGSTIPSIVPNIFSIFKTASFLGQAESVRKAEEERMKQEAKGAALRAAKERLDRLQATWREDQHLKEVCLPSPSVPLHQQYCMGMLATASICIVCACPCFCSLVFHHLKGHVIDNLCAHINQMHGVCHVTRRFCSKHQAYILWYQAPCSRFEALNQLGMCRAGGKPGWTVF